MMLITSNDHHHTALTLQLGWTLWPQPLQLTRLSASPEGLHASVPRHSVQIGTIGGFCGEKRLDIVSNNMC